MVQDLTYAEAARIALIQEMERDAAVWVLGEDIGPEGGSGGQYAGLLDRFSSERVVDTPISESMIMAAGVGAAVAGTRPVIEMRYADLAICAADEIVNQAAKIRYMFNGQARVPLVARQAMGITGGNAAQHAQSMEAWWIHVPGLVVVAPATPADNFGLLKAAIRNSDPVMYLEHKGLWKVSGPVDIDDEPTELGKARIAAAGTDVTIVSWSAMVDVCLQANRLLDQQGISAEIIDLRTLWPWDRDTVMTSIARTRHLLVVHESVRVCGFGAEIAADISEHMWDILRRPVRRLAGPRIPAPYSIPMEAVCRITPEAVAAEVGELLRERDLK